MFRYIPTICIIVCLNQLLWGGNEPKKKVQPKKELTSGELLNIIASDSFGGRKPGTLGMDKAIAFVENFLSNTNVKPFFKNSYRDSLSIKNIKTCNIVGVINPIKGDSNYSLISAHLDHLGRSYALEDSVYNGANDNASGVVTVLQIAKTLSTNKKIKNLLVVLFTGEEDGLKGSWHLAKLLKQEGINISYMLNFEMVGKSLTKHPKSAYITGYHRTNFAIKANQLIGSNFIVYEDIEVEEGLFSRSDNYPFYVNFLTPCHTLCTFDFTNYDYYHHVDDETDKIDINHLNRIIDKSTDLLRKIHTQKTTFQVTSN